MTDISESKLTTKKEPKNPFEIPDYCIEHTPTKSEKGGYVSKKNYIDRQDLNINKNEMLESVFIEFLSKSNKYTIIGCIYKYLKLTLAGFNQNFIQLLLDKLSFENKNIILLGDFNIDLLHYANDNQTRTFLDQIYSSSLSSQITTPTRTTPRPKTIIDNIFTNSADESSISGNLSYSISDHLAQFLIYLEFKTKDHQKQRISYKRNYSKDNLSNLKNKLQNIDRLNVLKANENNMEISLVNLLKIINALLDKHTPKKPITKKELKNYK